MYIAAVLPLAIEVIQICWELDVVQVPVTVLMGADVKTRRTFMGYYPLWNLPFQKEVCLMSILLWVC
jgi:hypothetical protein